MDNDSVAAYERHVAAVAAHDIDAVVAGYDPDAVKIGPEGGGCGHEYLRSVFMAASATVVDDLAPQTAVTGVGDVVLVVWRSGPGASVPASGADTFVFRDGLIVAHTEVRSSG